MTKINSSSLFHFTGRKLYLKSIITKGIRFSYSLEMYPKNAVVDEIYNLDNSETSTEVDLRFNTGVAIPMVCFCDIPLLRTTDHKQKYGNYAIGLNKELMAELYSPIINPVLYVNSDNLIKTIISLSRLREDFFNNRFKLINSERIQKKIKEEGPDSVWADSFFVKEVNKNIDVCFSIKFLMGLTKPYSYKNDKGETNYLYDEREWRVFWPENVSDESDWTWNITQKHFNKYRKKWNDILQETDEGYITLPSKMLSKGITHIIVATDSEINDLIHHIMESEYILGQKNVSKKDRLLLVSKLTSFERIENDY